MKQATRRLEIEGKGRGLTDVTATVAAWVADAGIRAGLLTAYVPHTSASLLIQENADPAVLEDLEQFLARLVPDGSHYGHSSEGEDDMPAHIRSALTQTHVAVPVADGRLGLGTWQSIYFYEHRTAPRERHLLLHRIGP